MSTSWRGPTQIDTTGEVSTTNLMTSAVPSHTRGFMPPALWIYFPSCPLAEMEIISSTRRIFDLPEPLGTNQKIQIARKPEDIFQGTVSLYFQVQYFHCSFSLLE